MIWFTADTHLGHANIIKYCNRPFSSVEEMDETIINNWNSVIHPSDTVYHLGDFAWKKFKYYKEQLNGKIHLIMGNHDYKRMNLHEKGLFESVTNKLILRMNPIYITLDHFANRVWEKSHFNCWHLYGHSHGTLEGIGKSMDVGVDTNGYFPYSLYNITTIMESLPDNKNYLKRFPGYSEKEFQEVKISGEE